MSNKNTKITYYSPKWISRRLDDVIDSTIESIGCFCVDSVSSFTKSRILTPKTLIKFILGLQAHSLPGEISDYFTSSDIDIPSSNHEVSQGHRYFLNIMPTDFTIEGSYYRLVHW